MIALREQLRPLFETVIVRSSLTAEVGGQVIRVAPKREETHGNGDQSGGLLESLAAAIYSSAFCRRASRASQAGAWSPDQVFAERLHAANSSRPRMESGWTVTTILPSGYVEATRDGFFRTCAPGDFLPDQPWRPVAAGEVGRLAFPMDSLVLQPGMYFAFGEAAPEGPEHATLLRSYWSVTSDGAPGLIRSLTRRLNAFHVPFRIKCPASPLGFDRVDALVLFTRRRYTRLLFDLSAEILQAHRADVRETHLLFAKVLELGLAIAEDPQNGDSFGMSRSRLVAQAVLDAAASGRGDELARWEALVDIFARSRLSVDRPFLNPDSTDRYAWARELSGAAA